MISPASRLNYYNSDSTTNSAVLFGTTWPTIVFSLNDISDVLIASNTTIVTLVLFSDASCTTLAVSDVSNNSVTTVLGLATFNSVKTSTVGFYYFQGIINDTNIKSTCSIGSVSVYGPPIKTWVSTIGTFMA